MNRRHHISRVLALGAVAILTFGGTACGITDSPDEVRRAGVILGYNLDDPQVVIPDTVQTGVEFVVEVTTYGSPCERKGETEVEYAADTVTISPYDYVQTIPSCFSMLVSFVHRATIQFSEPGLASVVIRGRAGGRMEDEAVEVVREVVVVEDQAPN